MPGDDGGTALLLSRIAAIEQRLLDDPRHGIDGDEARILIEAFRAQRAEAVQLRGERDAACRALLQDWPELPDLGPAEIEDLLEQLGLVAETAGEEGPRLQLTERGLAVLGLPDDAAPTPGPGVPDLPAICRALGLSMTLPTPESLRRLSEALLAAAEEPAFWPEAAHDESDESSSPSS